MHLRLIPVVLLLIVPAHLRAADDGFQFALFNGKNLAGWDITNCKVTVEDGALVGVLADLLSQLQLRPPVLGRKNIPGANQVDCALARGKEGDDFAARRMVLLLGEELRDAMMGASFVR